MKKKIYLIQPTYRDRQGRLLKERSFFTHSLALPALSAAVPAGWEKQFCLEHFEEVDYETDASVIGISCMVCDIFHACEIAQAFRQRGKTVLIGGCAAALWKRVVQAAADSVVLGNPGPDDLRRILQDAAAGRLAPEYQCGEDIDFPFDYSVLPSRRISFLPVLGSIGCAHRCEFCGTAAMWQGRYHLRPVETVMADLRALRRVTRYAAFVDTNLYNDRKHLMRLCELMIEERLNLVWGGECTLSVGDDPEALALLRRAGCRLLIIGIETLEQSSLRQMKKPNLAQRYEEQIRRIQAAGIFVAGFFVFGFDEDNPTSAADLAQFIRDRDIALPSVNLLTPIPGTKLFTRLKAEGRLVTSDELEFLQQNLLYDTPMYHCYYVPKRMSATAAEEACLHLRKQLSSLREVVRRSLVLNPLLAIILLRLNLSFRRETHAIATALRNERRSRLPGV